VTLKSYPRIGCEKGSIAVLVALLIPVMLIMVMLIANIGQLIFEKIRLQNVADVSLLAGLTVQSAGLNEIADLNYELELEYEKLKKILKSDTWYDESQGIKAITFYKRVFDYIRRYQDDANRQFAEWAKIITEKVVLSSYNKPDNRTWGYGVDAPSRLTNLSEPEKRPVGFRYVIPCSGLSCPPPIPFLCWNDGSAEPEEYEAPHDGRYYLLRPIKYLRTYSTEVNVRRSKLGPSTVLSVKIEQSPTDFILGKTFFPRLPLLRVRAKGGPNEGHIYNCEPIYRPRIME